MKHPRHQRMLYVSVVCLLMMVPVARSQNLAGEKETEREIAKITQIRMKVFEDTKRARNHRLNILFRDYAKMRGGELSAETVNRFNAMLRRHGMTSFDDFMEAEMRPLRYVKDPVSGEQVPVLGALGSDLINPWLAAAGVAEGRPLGEQPMYHSAANALREHVDFALMGIKDPQLSLALLPPELRKNARWAYQRLNPGGEFDGGFDHPLFYATVREAAKKLFRQDYPKAKLTMAELVVSEDQGGFGIRSCLLCHNQDHTGVYKRLLGQGLYLEAKAAELLQDSSGYSEVTTARRIGVDSQTSEIKAKAAVFRQAAEVISDTFPDKVDVEAARNALAMLSLGNLSRLKPGYDDFSGTLAEFGCLKCHSSNSPVARNNHPATYGAFVLSPNAYYKTGNIKALSALIDAGNLNNSKLLLKAANRVRHRGAMAVVVDPAQLEALQTALAKWLYGFGIQQQPRPRGIQANYQQP